MELGVVYLISGMQPHALTCGRWVRDVVLPAYEAAILQLSTQSDALLHRRAVSARHKLPACLPCVLDS